jgi:RNA polymerase sigma-B factor
MERAECAETAGTKGDPSSHVTASPRQRPNPYAHLAPLFKELADLPEGSPRLAAIRSELVEGYLPVAQHIARRFAGRGEPEDDLVQAGAIGLIGAIDRFDPGRGLDFLSFAVPTITGEIRRHFRDRTWAMRVPRRLKDIQIAISRAVDPLSQELGRAPRPTEIASRLGLPLEDVLEGLSARQVYRNDSLDRSTGSDDEQWADQLGDLDHGIEGVEYREALAPLLAALSDRERTILILRFFGNRTQSQIAEVIGVSQMHVSRLLDRTLKRLRHQLNGDG